MTFIVSVLSVGFGFVKERFTVFNASRLNATLTFVANYFIKILIMALVMVMNFYVCLAVVAGMAVGQVVFEYIVSIKKWKKVRKDESILSTNNN